MFQKHIHVHQPTRFISTEHHEYRAPTDQSVALLTEMEKKAEERITSVHRLKNNVLDAVWYVHDNPIDLDLRVTCKLVLNGQERTMDFKVERPWRKEQAKDVVRKLADELSAKLVTELLVTTQVQTLLTR